MTLHVVQLETSTSAWKLALDLDLTSGHLPAEIKMLNRASIRSINVPSVNSFAIPSKGRNFARFDEAVISSISMEI